MIVGTMCASVDVKRAGAADTLTAVMVERHRAAALASTIHRNRIATFTDKLLVENIEHFQERGVLLDSGNMIGFKMAFGLGVLLTPYFQIEFHRT